MDNKFNVRNICSISGKNISDTYEKNAMSVNFQGWSKNIEFPKTVALQGAPTCSVGISPYGLYNRFNDAGRLILLNQQAIQHGSAPVIRTGCRDDYAMLTQKVLTECERGDDIPSVVHYYYPPVAEKNITLSLATPSLEILYRLKEASITRRLISPFLSGDEQSLMPLGVEEYEVTNTSDHEETYTLIVPRPSLVNLQEKEQKPLDQDSVYIGSAAVFGHKHAEINDRSMRGIVMGSTASENRMVLAAKEVPGVKIDVQPYFCLNRLLPDLMLAADGSFYEKRGPAVHNDYGAALSLTFKLKAGSSITVPVVIGFDFPDQEYIDGKKYKRKYVKYFSNATTRSVDLARTGLENYKFWWDKTVSLQQKIYDSLLSSPSCKEKSDKAFRLTRLLCNEFHFPLSNAVVWIEDEKGNEQARFLESFDYSYIDPSDVDWYSPLLLMLFPGIEEELCQSFINSINAEDTTPRYYHFHNSFVDERMHFEEHPEAYEGKSLIQIRDDFKVKGTVAHDLGSMLKGHALRDVSDYAWYNSNYWVDLFPKLAMRVLRNYKYTGDTGFIRRNWKTLIFGLESLLKLDFDGDGIPEGYPEDVKNTFDNLVLFGADAYDAISFVGGCEALLAMARILGDESAESFILKCLNKANASLEKLWFEGKNSKGENLEYYIACMDTKTGKKNTDVWMNQLDTIWYMLACGEAPFLPENRIRNILMTIYRNNRTTMGWAMCRTRTGGKVKSEQGQDVFTTSNYVFAQLLDYYGFVRESQDVYKYMDKVVFGYGNSLITPDNLRAEMERNIDETEPHAHYIVAGYPRPGAIWTHLLLQFIREERKESKSESIDTKRLQWFISSFFNRPA